MSVLLYPGTFDPVTEGHVDLMRRGLRLFNRLVVAVAESRDKEPLFSLEERLKMIREVTGPMGNVEVCSFTGLVVDFARETGVTAILRGLRAVSDFEYEFQLAGMNRHLAPEIETLFLTPAEQCAYISSSLVREIASLGSDVTPFAHKKVVAALRGRMN